MALPVWPTGLRYFPDRGAWAAEPVRGPDRTPMDAGNIRLRAVPGMDLMTVDQVIRFSAADAATFNTFYATTLNYGSSRFTMPVCLDGTNMVTKTVQFDGKIKRQLAGLFLAVTMKLLVFP